MEADALEQAARRVASRLKHFPDSVLHPLRRRFLSESLRRSGVPESALFVCHGNICRSPYAAAAFARALPETLRERITVTSAGFIGPGRTPPENAIRVAEERGIDLQQHRSRLITLEDLETRHLIVVMDQRQRNLLAHSIRPDEQHLILLGDIDPAPIRTRRVHDPILQPPEVFEEVYARIDRCVAELVRVTCGRGVGASAVQ